MNVLLFTAPDRIAPNQIRITDGRYRHLIEVLNSQPGDAIRVGELGGNMGVGELVELDARQATITFTLTEQAPPKLPIKLVLALPRPKMLRRILRTVAELGVAELHLINSFRVEKSYWQSPVLGESSIRSYLIQGLEQARDTILPEILCHRRFKPFVEDLLPAMLTHSDALLAHPGDYPLAPRGPCSDTVLVIGPEGGFIPYEVDKLRAAGCTVVSLGERILRVENAVNSLLGRLA